MDTQTLKIMALACHLDIHMVDAEFLMQDGIWRASVLNDASEVDAIIRVQGITFFLYKIGA